MELSVEIDTVSGILPDSWEPALKQIKLLLFASIRDNFDGSHGPDGTNWKPLANNRPRNQGRGQGKPLLDKGTLRASMTTTGGKGHVENVGPLSLEVGTNLEYAALHQFGGVVKPKKAKMLALPLTREAVNYPSPRQFPRALFFFRSRGLGAKAFLAESKGQRKKKMVMHYLLLPSATIPAREFAGFSEAFLKQADEVLVEHMGQG